MNCGQKALSVVLVLAWLCIAANAIWYCVTLKWGFDSLNHCFGRGLNANGKCDPGSPLSVVTRPAVNKDVPPVLPKSTPEEVETVDRVQDESEGEGDTVKTTPPSEELDGRPKEVLASPEPASTVPEKQVVSPSHPSPELVPKAAAEGPKEKAKVEPEPLQTKKEEEVELLPKVAGDACEKVGSLECKKPDGVKKVEDDQKAKEMVVTPVKGELASPDVKMDAGPDPPAVAKPVAAKPVAAKPAAAKPAAAKPAAAKPAVAKPPTVAKPVATKPPPAKVPEKAKTVVKGPGEKKVRRDAVASGLDDEWD
ncbi:adhesin [Babesia caballi]|uniref:Adhesin n=1 Tax=Babesia caballi TaxID=5871 RepID=A0AAV4LLB2_BABCB|nr:adhesin [Babesia caballi]